MSYIPSINIEQNISDDFQYIVTPNAKTALGNIIGNYQSGHHAFTIIGTYGTGKSSFLLALEQDLLNEKKTLVPNPVVFNDCTKFEFLNIVGDYAPLCDLLGSRLGVEEKGQDACLKALADYYNTRKKKGVFVFIVVDEFGKILEYASQNNPEKELYFLQKLAEFVNVPTRNIILLTTLHQNFGAYAHKLSEQQQNEWQKIKGRFKEIIFVEPIEQLLYLATKQLDNDTPSVDCDTKNFYDILDAAKRAKAISNDIIPEVAFKLYPLDTVAATCLTECIQRYGQNERTLFSFLTAQGSGSFSEFKPTSSLTYNLAEVYDYVCYNCYTALNESNSDSMQWGAIKSSIERASSGVIPTDMVADSIKLIKSIGLLNMLCGNMKLNIDFIKTYASNALDICNAESIVDKLSAQKIIRFANYKEQYILFEGTDIDIEAELYKASNTVAFPKLEIGDIAPYINSKAALANASYYKTGTPRYFAIIPSNEPIVKEPTDDTDGIVNLIFPQSDILDEVCSVSNANTTGAIVYAYFNNADEIARQLYEIKKLQYVHDNVAFDDRVARNEIATQISFESHRLNELINDKLIANDGSVTWIFNGKPRCISSSRDFNALLSHICDKVYYKTPILRNELLNREVLSSSIAAARVYLLDAMLTNNSKADFGFPEDNFPPEKTIYCTLFKETGIHRQDKDGSFILGEPTSTGIKTLWDACCDFVSGSVDKPRKLTELVKILRERPYKLKQGVIDFWLPIFLFIKQQDFVLYSGNSFVLNITKEIFELLQKKPGDFSVKSLQVSGVKLEFFNKYREFLKKDSAEKVTTKSLIETIKPFFQFYRSLNSYAKTTRKFDGAYTVKFREVLSSATDPSKAFFEDLPAALGYNNINSDEFISQYIDIMRSSSKELAGCYEQLISRIENCYLQHLGIENALFDDYKPILNQRYASVNPNFLTPKCRSFYDRLTSPSKDRMEFVEKICFVIGDRRLETIKDSEEEFYIKELLYLFSELDRATSITDKVDDTIEEAFNFELATNKGKFSKALTFSLPKTKVAQANKVQADIAQKLTGDKDLDICILLKMINERL